MKPRGFHAILERPDLSPSPGPLHISPDLWRMACLWHLLEVRSAMSTGQDPTHVFAHLLGFMPGKNRVMCLVHGGKSIPWNVTLRGLCGTGNGVFPFPVKRLLLLRLWEGQGVRCTQCPLSGAHKTHSWCSSSIQKALGQWWKKQAPQWAPEQFFSYRNRVRLGLSQGKLFKTYGMGFYTFTSDIVIPHIRWQMFS